MCAHLRLPTLALNEDFVANVLSSKVPLQSNRENGIPQDPSHLLPTMPRKTDESTAAPRFFLTRLWSACTEGSAACSRHFVVDAVIIRLQPFLLAQLERAASQASTSATGALGREPKAGAGGGRGVREEMHPVLYPILLLLARLRSGDRDVTEAIKMEVRQSGQ